MTNVPEDREQPLPDRRPESEAAAASPAVVETTTEPAATPEPVEASASPEPSAAAEVASGEPSVEPRKPTRSATSGTSPRTAAAKKKTTPSTGTTKPRAPRKTTAKATPADAAAPGATVEPGAAKPPARTPRATSAGTDGAPKAPRARAASSKATAAKAAGTTRTSRTTVATRADADTKDAPAAIEAPPATDAAPATEPALSSEAEPAAPSETAVGTQPEPAEETTAEPAGAQPEVQTEKVAEPEVRAEKVAEPEPQVEEPVEREAHPEPEPEPEAEPEIELPAAVPFLTPSLTVQSPPVAPRPVPRRRSDLPEAQTRELGAPVLTLEGLTKRFGANVAVDGIDLEVREGSFYGIVGPNGAGKTTTLSMITGLLRPDSGQISVHGIDVWRDPVKAKRTIGVLPDALRLFDRLTGAQLLYYSGTLRGLDAETVRTRSADLVAAFGIEDAVDRLVADYSAGMTKKIALAAAMIHSPRLLVLDEPFESVDPVSAANLNEILQKYVEAGGTVVLSSHGMDFIQRVCDHVAIIVSGRVLAAGTMDEVRGGATLEDRFVELAGGRKAAEGMEWLHSFSD